MNVCIRFKRLCKLNAYKTINEFETELEAKAKELGDEHMFDDILNISSDSMQKAKAAINEYGDIFKQALTAEIVYFISYGNSLFLILLCYFY